jgi:hypothetical protein
MLGKKSDLGVTGGTALPAFLEGRVSRVGRQLVSVAPNPIFPAGLCRQTEPGVEGDRCLNQTLVTSYEPR